MPPKMKPLKKLKGDELLDILANNGILHEANRTFFNPIGLKLTLNEDLTISIEKSDDEWGILLDTVDKFSTQAYMKYAQGKKILRQEYTGFIIQTRDMIRKNNLETPVTPPSSIKLNLLLKQVDNFAYNIKKRLMEKSKTYDTELFSFDESALSYDMFEDLQNDNFIDGVTRAIMLSDIENLNEKIKKIREIDKKQKKVYREKR
jgi:hypothetical protein